MLVYDMQPNGVAPVITDILSASTSNAFMNLTNRDRFKVIWDRDVSLGPVDNTSGTAYADRTQSLAKCFKPVNLEVIFGGTAATIGSIQTGALWLVTIGSVAATYQFSGAVRVRFADA